MAKASKAVHKPVKKKPRKVSRNSDTGEFVTKEYADKHPDTTQTETIQAWERGHSVKCAKDQSK